MSDKICGVCKKKKTLDNFYGRKYGGYDYHCKTCHNKKSVDRQKKSQYFSSSKGRLGWLRASKKAYEKHREKWLARAKTRYAVKVGKLEKLPCEVCGKVKVEAHHTDYSDHLNVVWLCQFHHREIENRVGIK